MIIWFNENWIWNGFLSYFFNHGFFTELHRIIKPPDGGKLKIAFYYIFFRVYPCLSVVNIFS